MTLMRRAIAFSRAYLQDTAGATAIEYSLIIALIFMAIVASVRSFTDETNIMYDEIASAVQDRHDP